MHIIKATGTGVLFSIMGCALAQYPRPYVAPTADDPCLLTGACVAARNNPAGAAAPPSPRAPTFDSPALAPNPKQLHPCGHGANADASGLGARHGAPKQPSPQSDSCGKPGKSPHSPAIFTVTDTRGSTVTGSGRSSAVIASSVRTTAGSQQAPATPRPNPPASNSGGRAPSAASPLSSKASAAVTPPSAAPVRSNSSRPLNPVPVTTGRGSANSSRPLPSASGPSSVRSVPSTTTGTFVTVAGAHLPTAAVALGALFGGAAAVLNL